MTDRHFHCNNFSHYSKAPKKIVKEKYFRRYPIARLLTKIEMSDWDTVTVLKKKPLKAAQMKTEAAINQASE